MAKKTVGALIKEARTAAGLTQEGLAKKVTGASASDIGKAERGEKELTTAQLKEIAKATGVTQKSLLDAAKGSSGKTSGSSGKKGSSSTTSVKLTAAEKKLIEAYRAADSDKKKAALKLLKGDTTDADEVIQNIIGGVVDVITGKK